MTVITGSSISDDQLFGFDSLLICYFFVICKFLFANHDNCVIIIKHERNMLSWSSGQDVALSRRNQGFDSPREYQKPWNHNVPRLLLFCGIQFITSCKESSSAAHTVMTVSSPWPISLAPEYSVAIPQRSSLQIVRVYSPRLHPQVRNMTMTGR